MSSLISRCPHCGGDVDQSLAVHMAADCPEANCEETDADRHRQLVREIVEEFGDAAPREIHSAYQDRADDPRGERAVRNYLVSLVEAGHVEAVGKRRGRRYVTAE